MVKIVRADGLAALAASLGPRWGSTPYNSSWKEIADSFRRNIVRADIWRSLQSRKALEPVEDWWVPFLGFLERDWLPDDPIKRIKIKRRADKFVVGPFMKATTREYKYSLTGTDYFSKQAEVIKVRVFTTTTVVEFIQVQIIYWLDPQRPSRPIMVSSSKARLCTNWMPTIR